MRIAYLSNSVVPSRQANSVHVVNMAAALASLGHEVVLWAYPGEPLATGGSRNGIAEIAEFYGVPGRFTLRCFEPSGLPGRTTIDALKSGLEVRRSKVDLVIGRHPKACAIAALAGVPVVFETHQPITWYPRPDRLLLRAAIWRRAFRGIVTISLPLQEILRQETGFAESDFLLCHDAATSHEGVERMPLGTADRPQVGYVGHLYRGRGVDLIVEVARRIPEADFHLIGGTAEDIAVWSQYAEGVSNLVFHGFVPPYQVAAMRLGCDILLAPYQSDTSIPGGRVTAQWMSPLKIFEYMSSGTVFVASDLPVFIGVLRDRHNCLLAPPDSLLAWERTIRELIAAPALRDRLGAQAQQDFLERFTWRARAQKIVEFGMRASA